MPPPTAYQTDGSGADDNGRKRDVEEEDRGECHCGDTPHHRVFECFSSDAYDRRDHNRGHRWFQSVEDRRNPGNASELRVDVTQCPEDEDRWNDEEGTSDNTAPRFVQEPANVDGKLLRFWSWQQHAVIERVQKTRLANPSLLFDQLRLHHRDLSGRSAE